MTLNNFINKLIEIRDTNNIGNYTICNSELVYDVMCGEIQEVTLSEIPLNEEDLYICDKNKSIWIQAVNN